MPNWCWLHISARGDKKELDLVEEVGMNFEYILPMPTVLKRTEDKSLDEWDKMALQDTFGYKSWYEWRNKNWGTKTPFCPLVRDTASTDCVEVTGDNAEESISYFELPICKRVIVNSLEMRGKVAWGFPMPIMMELSALFPTVRFDVEYGDEGNDNVDCIVFKGGDILPKVDTCMNTMYGELDNWLENVMGGCR